MEVGGVCVCVCVEGGECVCVMEEIVLSLLLATREGERGCVCVMEEIVLSLLLATRVRVGFVSLMVMPATRNGN